MMRFFTAVLLTAAFGIAGAAAPAVPAPMASTVKGEVLEVKGVDAYTYLRLKTADGEIWAAVNKAPVAKGAQVTIVDSAVMTNFESKTLKKTFDRIVFGTLAGAPAPTAEATTAGAGATPASSMGAMHAGLAKPVEVGDVKVAKATGANARTVAEIVTKGPELKNKAVLVRGKVVKYTPGVMSKNWVHIRDGSGSASDKTDDVLVTTKDETKVGDVVLVKGTVHTDVDLGSGYAYKVLVEDATIQK